MMHSKRLVDCLPFLVLAIYASFEQASAIEKRGVHYRRNRSTEANVFLQEEFTVTRSNEKKLGRVESTAELPNTNNVFVPPTRKVSKTRFRTRGVSSSGKPQNRRELGKSSGKSGSSGSSGGSGGGGGGGSGGGGSGGGGGSRSSSGWNSGDGSYCGCLCFSDNDMYGVNDQGVSCDFTYDQKSYGFYQSNNNPNNSGSYLPSYFNYNPLTDWNMVQNPNSNNYFTEYGYEKQNYQDEEWQTYEGRNGNDDQNDDEENNQDEIVVVNQMDSGYDPYQAFDIGSCDTYSHLWTYDLLVTCAGGDQYCQCTFTEELMQMGLLSCSDVDKCPSECEVCSNCIQSICDQSMPSKIVASAVGGNAVITTAAIFGTVLLAFCVALKHDQSIRKGGQLNESLMDTDNETSYSSKNWSVPVNEDGLPTDEQNSKNKRSKPVWLAPDVSTIPTKPLFPDLLKGANDEKKKSPKQRHEPSRQDQSKRQRQRQPRQQSQSESDEQDCERVVVELSPVTSKERPTKEKHYPIGPLMLASSNQSIPSSISSNSNNCDSRIEDNEDSYGFSQQHETHPDGKSISTSEGEI